MRAVATCVVMLLFSSRGVSGQSSLLTALETSPPAPILDPIAGGPTHGLAVIWGDPTSNGEATGMFFGVLRGNYASIRVLHAGLAFRLGPRWSLSFAQADLGNLFDTSLTNQDPGLAALHARAVWGRFDGTIRLPRLTTSLGLALAGDDNVGVFQTSTVGRAHVRVFPLKGELLEIGVQASRALNGSVPVGEGRWAIDVTLTRPIGRSQLSATVATFSGNLWRYSDTRQGSFAALRLSVLTQLELGVAMGRYSPQFGQPAAISYRAASAAIRVGNLQLATRYASTLIGIGSGLALSLSYEPLRLPRTKAI